MDGQGKLRILELNPQLGAFEGDLNWRVARYSQRLGELLSPGQTLSDFAMGAHYFGLHRTDRGWVYREWAPGAQALHLTGEFNDWNRESHPLRSLGGGSWEIDLEGEDAIREGSLYKVCVTGPSGWKEDRIPLYANYVTEDENHNFSARVFEHRQPFPWTDRNFRRTENLPPVIYEAHVGMGTEEERVGTYLEFARDVLPRVKAGGYNTIQLMAIMEHPYYGSFGYQVSNFFAASSRFGTPDDLKTLINTAHSMGITVLLDLVHSHAVKNTAEGINGFDGTPYQFFKDGDAGNHPAWDSKVFDYGKNGVVHFLLSNIRFWLEEYHFDGFRFDGVTSMLYLDHGLGTAFTDDHKYFSMNTDIDAVTYLQLATTLCHEFRPGSLCVAEDMSAMPGICLPVDQGGIGFDYRLNLGVPDFFIRTIKEKRDGDWSMSRMFWELIARRPEEKVITYAECHDQALVGDKTIMFRLADKEMYFCMDRASENYIIDRAMALHKMIRLVTMGAGGDGYLNFMGNEFGHPEWIDFPREGNGWSFAHARRLWSLADNELLRYSLLRDFDRDVVHLLRRYNVSGCGVPDCILQHEQNQLLVFRRSGLVFAFNFHPEWSQPDFLIPRMEKGYWRVVLTTDDPAYGGFGNVDDEVVYRAGEGTGMKIYLPARSAVVLALCDEEGKLI